MRKSYQLLSGALFLAIAGMAQTTTFSYTGAMQTYTVPPCMTLLHVDVSGAQGGGYSTASAGGMGGRVEADIPVTPGQTLYIFVGGQGDASSAAGYNGGGVGFGGSPTVPGGGGGGASDIRTGGTTLADRIVVAGGGGGGVDNGGPATGGNGGGLTGGQASPAANPWACTPLMEATGGTQSAGGLGGTSSSCAWNGNNGTLGVGGASYQNYRCAGGGGGYYGGGGGHNGCGGAGGSSYTYASATNVVHTQGYQAGNGVVVVTAMSVPSAITGSPTLCAGSSGTYSISAMSGATSYVWSVPTGTIINSGQGTTSINITAGSTSGNIDVYAVLPCGNSSTQTLGLTIDPVSVAGTPAASSNGLCVGDSLWLSVTGETGSVAWESSMDGGITWNPFGSGNPFSPGAPSLSDTGSYLMHAVVTSGTCASATSSNLSVVVYPPANAGTITSTASTVCSGSSVTLNSAGASSGTLMWYEFDGVNYNYLGSGNGFVTAGIPAGMYNFVAMLTSGGCGTDTSNMIMVMADSAAMAGTPATSSGANVCVNDSVSFMTTGSVGSIEWLMLDTTNNTWMSFGFGNPFSPGAPNSSDVGMYTFAAVASNGVCPSDTSAQMIVNVRPLPVVNLGADTSVCSSVMLDAGNAGSTYLWNDGSTTQTITVTVPGQYYSIVTSPYGCMGSDTINVNITTPTVAASAASNTACTTDAPVALTGTPAGGTWSGTGVTGTSFSPSTAGLGAHTLVYMYTDSITGCSNSDSVTITVSACTGIAEQYGLNTVSVFPNPNNGTFTISTTSDLGNLLIEVVDMQGQRVLISEEKNVKSGFAKQITLEGNAEGIYFVRMIADGQQSVMKINVVK